MESKFSEMTRLCSLACERLNGFYPKAYGWMEHCKTQNPHLWQELKNAQKVIEEPEKSAISVEAFSEVLRKWETLCKKGIFRFLGDSKRDKQSSDGAVVRPGAEQKSSNSTRRGGTA